MPAPLTVRTILFVVAPLTAIAIAHPLARSWAEQPSMERVSMFRVLFPEGTGTPIESGDVGERNRQAIARIAGILPHWSSQRLVRFLYVAPRSATCVSRDGCNPEQLLWQRVNAATALVQASANGNGQRLRFDLIGMAFADEFVNATEPGFELPAPPPGTAAIDLRLYVDNDPPDANCPWRVSLFDPDLPPVIGAANPINSIPLTPNATAVVGEAASLAISPARQEIPGATAVWETPDGQFCMAAPALLGGSLTPIPRRPARLHIIAFQAGDREASQFADSLGEGCRTDVTPPKPLVAGKSTWPKITKGVGDNVELLSPGELQPPALKAIAPLYCQLTFMPIPPTGTPPSR